MSAPLRVRREETADGWWEAVAPPVAPWLAPHVRGYYGFTERSPRPVRRRELPIDAVVLIVGFATPYDLGYPHLAGRDIRAHSFVAGLHDTWCVVDSPPSQSCIQVNLTALGARRLLGTAMHELVNRSVDLGDLIGPESGRLSERLAATDSWEARFALVDAMLAARLAGAPDTPPDVAWALGRLTAPDGAPPVGALCRDLGCSRRHLERRFRDQVGLSPKAYARVVRFERAVGALGRGVDALLDASEAVAERGRLGALAVDCGYYDQAHMNRDFRALAGLTPAEVAAGSLG